MQLTENVHGFLWQSNTTNNANAYFIDGPRRILIDPGHRALFEHVENGLSTLGYNVSDIGLVISTHIHPDHVEGAGRFRELETLTALNEADWRLAERLDRYSDGLLHLRLAPISPDFFLTEGTLDVAGTRFQVYHTPGHSPGSISLYLEKDRALFSGDLLFQGGIGRTDLPGGNPRQLMESIKRLKTLDAEHLFPGHGGVVSGREAVRANFEDVERYYFEYL
jgi:glyoxylase-like metal-dependent hydrolase (beta-lactamase superfamily II)